MVLEALNEFVLFEKEGKSLRALTLASSGFP